MTEERPKVGIGVVVFKDGKILLSQRQGAHGTGYYAGPGGHLEFMESFEECARREVREETGMEVKNVAMISVTNFKIGDKHYVDIGMKADWASGKPRVLEPDRHIGWNWYELGHLPKPLLPVVANYINALKTGRWDYDA